MYEHHKEPVLPLKLFLWRLLGSVSVGLLVFTVSLGIGMLGYHRYGPMPWLDAFTNASMILSGMGPLGEPMGPELKLFAGIYALFSGLAFAAVLAFFFAPIAHRILHRLHHEKE